MIKYYIQQGDVLMFKVNEKIEKKDAKEIQGNLIHKGQNHHHTINGDFKLYEKDGKMFIRVKSDCELNHEEHKTIIIPKGLYEKRIVREYSHWDEESREVLD